MKRYNSEEEIIAEMDKAKAKSIALQRTAEAIEEDIAARVKDMDSTGSFVMIEKVNYDRKEARRCRALASSLIENRLEHLKRKLAEFRTPQLAGIDNGDVSIPA